MKTFAKIAVRIILILIVICLLLVVVIRSLFVVSPMRTGSMQPLISSNDVVVAAKWFHAASLHNGDLVVVNIPTPAGQILTVRKVEQQTNTPNGQFYLQAVSTNGVDSRQFGTLPLKNIRGRVIWIIKAN